MEDKKDLNENEVIENDVIDVDENQYSKKEESKNKTTSEPKANDYYQQDSNEISPKKKINTFSLIGFISSLVFFVPFITDIAGLVFSILGLKETSKKNERGRGLAIAGIIISSLRILFMILILAVSIYMIVENGFYHGDFDYYYD